MDIICINIFLHSLLDVKAVCIFAPNSFYTGYLCISDSYITFKIASRPFNEKYIYISHIITLISTNIQKTATKIVLKFIKYYMSIF